MLSNWSSGEDSWEYLGLQGTDNIAVNPDGNETVRKYWEFLIINDKLSRDKYRSMSMAHHKVSRKIKEIGASMWGSLLQLHFCISPNLTCYSLQVLFMKHRTFGVCGFLGNDGRKTKYSHKDHSASTVESQGQSTSDQHFKILQLIIPNYCLVSWVRDIIPQDPDCCHK